MPRQRPRALQLCSYPQWTPDPHTSRSPRHLSFAPRQYGLLLSAASEDGCVHLWEADRPLAPNSWTLQSRVQVRVWVRVRVRPAAYGWGVTERRQQPGG